MITYIIAFFVSMLGMFALSQGNPIQALEQQSKCYKDIYIQTGLLPPEKGIYPNQSRFPSIVADERRIIESIKNEPEERKEEYIKELKQIKMYGELFDKDAKSFAVLRYEANSRISEACGEDSVAPVISENTLANVKKYLSLLHSSYEGLNQCHRVLVHGSLISKNDFFMRNMNDDLFTDESFQLYMDIKNDLSSGNKNAEMLSDIIDEMLLRLFYLSNLCSSRYELLRESPCSNSRERFPFMRTIEENLSGFGFYYDAGDYSEKQKIIDDMKEKRNEVSERLMKMLKEKYGY